MCDFRCSDIINSPRAHRVEVFEDTVNKFQSEIAPKWKEGRVREFLNILLEKLSDNVVDISKSNPDFYQFFRKPKTLRKIWTDPQRPGIVPTED